MNTGTPRTSAITAMQEQILHHVESPQHLENLYQQDHTTFRQAFERVYPSIRHSAVSEAWKWRLQSERSGISLGDRREWLLVLLAIAVAGMIARIPLILGWAEDEFYARNLGFIVFPLLTAWFAWKQGMSPQRIFLVSLLFAVSAFYMNALPDQVGSDTLVLACLHMPVFLWSVVGLAFIGERTDAMKGRSDFLRFNGDLVVMSALLFIGAVLLLAVSIALFGLADVQVEHFYQQYVAVFGLPAIPIIASYLVRTNPLLVGKVSPVIARIFTPLVAITLAVYLVTVLASGKDPYTDREFLMLFNLVLIGVMALIFFSLPAMVKEGDRKVGTSWLIVLAALALLVNAVALTAILFRISEWGISPNRLAVLGSNVLMFFHLMIVFYRLIQGLRATDPAAAAEESIARYLPVYAVWAAIVAFAFPVVFGFS